jgi:rhamnogalacturonan endolyase
MRTTLSPFRRGLAVVAAGAALVTAGPPGAALAAPPADAGHQSRPQLEHLDRGLVAVTTAEGTFLSWRLLAPEVTGGGQTGMTGADFRVYRDDQLIATVTDSTNHLDKGAPSGAGYRVAAVVDGQEVDVSDTVTAWAQDSYDLPLQKPAGGVTPAGEAYTYEANDMSVGDVDGDGQYEYVVKWYPSNAKDNSQVGYTGNVYLDTYELDGTLLNRLDLGVNIRAGAHYTQFLVYDFDGDGRSEIMLKTAPGTKSTTYENGAPTGEQYVTLPQDDVAAGVTNADDYRLSAAGYHEHLVDVFQGWSSHPEVVNGHWPATIEEALGIAPQYNYPRNRADATALVDHFIDVYAKGRHTNPAYNQLRSFQGFVLSGPEYLSVFDGATGRELDTVPYSPGRADDGLMWGDYAGTRIEPGNRVDRFLSGVAYLDGAHPSAVFARGYYTRSTVVSWDWNGKDLTQHWAVDSGFVTMTNPFNDTPHGRDGTDPEFGTIANQGFHSLSAADVDGDGKQEVVYGAATIDDDGSLLYSSTGVIPSGPNAGTTAKLGHGDSVHVTDIDPDRPGQEVFTVHENGTGAPYGYALRNAKTGQVIYGGYTGKDTGRGMVGDIDPAQPGLETWAVQLRTADGDVLGTRVPGTNQSIRWAADMTTQVVNGTGDTDVTIDDWTRGRLLTATGTRSDNGTKGNPSLVADVFGDWREELLVRTADSSAVRVFTSTEVTDRKLYTLMHDPQYRAEVARQQTAYNQTSYTSFYLGSDIDWAATPVPGGFEPGALPALRADLDALGGSQQLRAFLDQAQRHLDAGRDHQSVDALDRFLDKLAKDRIRNADRASLAHQARTVIDMLS